MAVDRSSNRKKNFFNEAPRIEKQNVKKLNPDMKIY